MVTYSLPVEKIFVNRKSVDVPQNLICLVCNKPVDQFIVMPFGSDFNGAVICDNCVIRLFDPVLEDVLHGRDDRLE